MINNDFRSRIANLSPQLQAVADRAAFDLTSITLLPLEARAVVSQAYLDSVKVVFYICVALSGTAFLLSLLIGKLPPGGDKDTKSAAEAADRVKSAEKPESSAA